MAAAKVLIAKVADKVSQFLVWLLFALHLCTIVIWLFEERASKLCSCKRYFRSRYQLPARAWLARIRKLTPIQMRTAYMDEVKKWKKSIYKRRMDGYPSFALTGLGAGKFQ